MSTIIDFLTEDPEITGQKYALISIVGPHMKQKCDVWGLKVRGVASSVDQAKIMTKKLMSFDKDYDIYTVEIGKFFPLNVKPYDVQDIEYENEQLNALVKNYLANKESANEHWNNRKQQMMKDALKEGNQESQAELALKSEHPVAVLQRVVLFQEKMKELESEMKTLKQDLVASEDKFSAYSDDERNMANDELKSASKFTETKRLEETNSIEEINEPEFSLGQHDSLFQ